MRLKNFFGVMFLFVLTFFTAYAFADSTVVTPTDFFNQILQTITSFGGLSWVLKVSAIVTLVISSMKVTFLNDLFWSKLGSFQAWLAPILGLIGGLVSMLAGGTPLTLASVLAFLSAGAGALILHELLDTIKAVPGIGAVWVSIINAIESVLGGPHASAPNTVQLK